MAQKGTEKEALLVLGMICVIFFFLHLKDSIYFISPQYTSSDGLTAGVWVCGTKCSVDTEH